jgi:hypothetical protein
LLLVAACTVGGLPYFLSSPVERVRSPLHAWFRPSGHVGQSLGLLALGLFLFIWLYPLRKKARFMQRAGPVGAWLDYHVAAGLLVPLVAATHASWRGDGLIGLGFAAMLVVSLSGVFGRYLYGRIPRNRSGIELSRAQVEEERARLLRVLAQSTGRSVAALEADIAGGTLLAAPRGALATLGRLAADEVLRWRDSSRLATHWLNEAGGDRALARKVRRLARRSIALDQQMHLLEETQRVLRYWHVAHRPIALTALLAVLAHVVVAVAMGATWFW